MSVQRATVLAIDDDRAQLNALRRIAQRDERIELLAADNAIDGMLQLATTRPDVVVMDIFMPGLDGIEACRRIRSTPETRDVRVVLMSAGLTSELESLARDAGASDVLAKPLTADTLAAIARNDRDAQPAPAEHAVELSAPPTQVRGADVLVQMLADAGVEVVFGLPGGAISPVHDALLDSNIRVITTRHEAGAMFAAAGYARSTGKLGVVAVTSGPGALNALTGLASAWCDGLPVLLLVGEVPRPVHGKGVLQDGSAYGLQIVEMTRHVTKLAAEVPRPSALPHLLRRAIATATSGRQGPVVLTLPLDVTSSSLVAPRFGGTVTLGETVATSTVDEIIDLVRAAERPLLVAGSGVRGRGGPERLRAAAEHLGCPVVTTPKGKGVFPELHPLALGVLGMGGHTSARRYLDAGVDVVVAIGTSLGDIATDGFADRLQASRALVHVDIDVKQIGKSYSPTHAVVASAAELLGGVVERIEHRALAPRTPIACHVDRTPIASSPRSCLIAPQDALREIQEALPNDAIFTIDSGEHFVFAVHYLRTQHPDAFIAMTGLGSMGQSIGAAIGAQLAYPGRAVAAICGDGCFAMNAFEIATAVAERLPIRVFVFNDQRMAMVENGHEHVYGRRPSYPTAPLDVCAIARGLGAATRRIDRVGQLRSARQELRDYAGPAVFDVQIDHHIRIPKIDRIAAIVAPPKNEPESRTLTLN